MNKARFSFKFLSPKEYFRIFFRHSNETVSNSGMVSYLQNFVKSLQHSKKALYEYKTISESFKGLRNLGRKMIFSLVVDFNVFFLFSYFDEQYIIESCAFQ